MSSERTPRPPARATFERDDAVAVINAYGLFRLLLLLLAAWTFFAGFALLTQGFGAISFISGGGAAERIVGAHLLLLAPLYGLLAWRRDQYRLLMWIPYAAQLAIILPTAYELLSNSDGDFGESALLLVVSIIFLALLVYLWWSSHPLGFFEPEDEDGEEDDEDNASDEDEDAGDDTPPAPHRPPFSGRGGAAGPY